MLTAPDQPEDSRASARAARQLSKQAKRQRRVGSACSAEKGSHVAAA